MTTRRDPQASFAASLDARVLRALFELAQLDRPAHAGALASVLTARSTDVARALVRLDRRGLVTADRARLTFVGLALATKLPALGLEAEAKSEARPVHARRLRGPVKVRGARRQMPVWTPVARLASH